MLSNLFEPNKNTGPANLHICLSPNTKSRWSNKTRHYPSKAEIQIQTSGLLPDTSICLMTCISHGCMLVCRNLPLVQAKEIKSSQCNFFFFCLFASGSVSFSVEEVVLTCRSLQRIAEKAQDTEETGRCFHDVIIPRLLSLALQAALQGEQFLS